MARRVTGNLPAEVTSFVGRHDELAAARRLLPTTRVLTLLGPGGVGKTRLSRQLGSAVGRAFRDGVWLVELADVRDPDLVTLSVAEALNLRDDTTDPLPRLLEFLAGRRLLLILDNCEHLIDACAAVTERIVTATDDVRVVATSREVLGIGGEQVMPVPPLPVGDRPGASGATADRDADSDAVRLLVERASAVTPGFASTPANRATLAQISRRLDGMPLALELAALRFRVFSPAQILDRLDDTMDLLRSGPRTAPQRQQTIEGAIRWSYELCTPAEQVLWQQLSVFAGGLDIDAAEAVCTLPGAEPDLLGALTGLVDKSVLVLRSEEDFARYSMLEPIRQFGHDRLLESGAEAAVRARHRDHYRRLALRGQRAYGNAEDLDWFRTLAREHANMRSALQFSLTDAPELAMDAATALRPYWEHYRFLSEGYRWLTDALARTPATASPERARGLASAASLAALLADRESAARLTDESVTMATELGTADVLAEARLDAALIAFADGDTGRALALSDQAVALAREAGVAATEMDSLSFGFMCATLLEDDRSTAIAEAFRAMTERRGPHMLGGLALWSVGIDHWRHGNQDAAAAFMSRAVETFADFDRCVWLASVFDGMAWSAAARGDMERSARLMGAALTLQRSTVRLAHTITTAIGDKVRVRVRDALGEEEFRAAYDSGSALPLPAAIDYALGRTTEAAAALTPDTVQPKRVDGAAPAVLTRRETDVARLIAAGYSNKRIATELVISVRTAETHVDHILTKLDFTSRTQIAAWAHDHDL
ncbi:LuxR C-terminal-related transcriptional regulator [Nocardia sp. NEAU-G5]|uniref:LuxR C-terminal-related transcriptional regulator n=1 Tax=Nocardia albiluteola TaxID=2842303 RepID=A0ABS6B0S8_9NOCA|nr:LuxR C-terminal-related transcriptional regulator [Nocardia albiluteola]MBU3062848.1 LuxR C-terminal-related transcriptional regulator [Nocardia albiluteola]